MARFQIGDNPVSRYIPGYSTHDHQHLRSIGISLDFRESICSAMAWEVIDDQTNYHLGFDSSEEVDLVLDHHNYVATNLHQHLAKTLATTLVVSKNLRTLQINVQNTTCSAECHRLTKVLFTAEAVQDAFEYFADNAHQMESLDLLSTINERERQAILSALPLSLRDKVTFDG
jgi:hypothetical protein